MFNQVRHFELAIIFFVILLGGLLAHQLGYALRLNTAWHAVLFLALAPLLRSGPAKLNS